MAAAGRLSEPVELTWPTSVRTLVVLPLYVAAASTHSLPSGVEGAAGPPLSHVIASSTTAWLSYTFTVSGGRLPDA